MNTNEASVWTNMEKDHFMKSVDALVTLYWNLIPGAHLVLSENPKIKHSINIIIEAVTCNTSHSDLSKRAHWAVNVVKYIDGKLDTVTVNSRVKQLVQIDSTGLRNLVNWRDRKVQLKHNSISGSPIANAPSPMSQIGLIHEVGHMLGFLDDEYEVQNRARYGNDDSSIMCYGHTIRDRHYDYLKKQLAFMKQIHESDIIIYLR